MSTPADLEFRSGIGFDSHPLIEGRRLVLGGVEIPHERGLSGHSDGDVLVHAVMDPIYHSLRKARESNNRGRIKDTTFLYLNSAEK